MEVSKAEVAVKTSQNLLYYTAAVLYCALPLTACPVHIALNTVPLATVPPNWNIHVSVLQVELCISTHLFKMESRPRPSLVTRLSFAVNNAERGETVEEPTDAAAEQQIEEEIAEIKRYEVNGNYHLPPPPFPSREKNVPQH